MPGTVVSKNTTAPAPCRGETRKGGQPATGLVAAIEFQLLNARANSPPNLFKMAAKQWVLGTLSCR
jgi:hypothetical protein